MGLKELGWPGCHSAGVSTNGHSAETISSVLARPHGFHVPVVERWVPEQNTLQLLSRQSWRCIFQPPATSPAPHQLVTHYSDTSQPQKKMLTNLSHTDGETKSHDELQRLPWALLYKSSVSMSCLSSTKLYTNGMGTMSVRAALY